MDECSFKNVVGKVKNWNIQKSPQSLIKLFSDFKKNLKN